MVSVRILDPESLCDPSSTPSFSPAPTQQSKEDCSFTFVSEPIDGTITWASQAQLLSLTDGSNASSLYTHDLTFLDNPSCSGATSVPGKIKPKVKYAQIKGGFCHEYQCGFCADKSVCQNGAIDRVDGLSAEGRAPIKVYGGMCDGCGECKDMCPQNKIEFRAER